VRISYTFPPKKILGRLLNEASVCNSSEFNTYSAYVHKKLALLKNLRANWNTADLIELVGYGIRDAKVQEAVYLRNFESISDLISYLSSLVKAAVDDVRTKRPAELSIGTFCWDITGIGLWWNDRFIGAQNRLRRNFSFR
jgi:hypothetical protein